MTETITQPQRRVLTLDVFGKIHPAFPPSVMRNLLWKAQDRHSSQGVIKGNGLGKAVVRIGRRIYIDEARFFEWLDSQQAEGHSHG